MRRSLLPVLAFAAGCVGFDPGDTVPPTTVESFCATCVEDTEEGSCVEDLTVSRIYSEMMGCGTEFQALLQCAESNGTCNGAQAEFETLCKPAEEALSACGGGIQ